MSSQIHRKHQISPPPFSSIAARLNGEKFSPSPPRVAANGRRFSLVLAGKIWEISANLTFSDLFSTFANLNDGRLGCGPNSPQPLGSPTSSSPPIDQGPKAAAGGTRGDPSRYSRVNSPKRPPESTAFP